MAAYDALDGFIGSLSEAERSVLQHALRTVRAELLAARSEDARVRLVHDFIRDAKDLQAAAKKGERV